MQQNQDLEKRIKGIKKFLKVLNKDTDKFILCSKWLDKDNIPHITYNLSIKQCITNNMNKNDIYLIPNFGGKTNNEINIYNAFFIDMDAGKTSDGKYLDYRTVMKEKRYLYEELIRCPATPSIIVETRNGYHAYWVLDKNIALTQDEWIKGQRQLINYFQSDNTIVKPANLMRLPNTNWYKNSNTLKPFMITIKKISNKTYNPCKLLETLSCEGFISNLEITSKRLQSVDITVFDRCQHDMLSVVSLIEYIFSLKVYDTTTNNTNKTHTNIDISMLRGHLYKIVKNMYNKAQTVDMTTFYEGKEFVLKNVDLSSFLNIKEGCNSVFNCIFHNDDKASAIVYKPCGRYKYYTYVCFGECNSSYNIFDIVSLIFGIDYISSVKFVFKLYNIKIKDESEWYKTNKLIIENNEDIVDEGDLELKAPTTYSMITRYRCYIELLMYLHRKGRRFINYNVYHTKTKRSIFFIEQRTIAAFFKTSQSMINKRIAFLCFLKLIEKVDDKYVPYKLFKSLQISRKNKEHTNSIHFYMIPEYNIELFKQMEYRAILWKKNHCTIKGISYEMFLRIFGQELANTIYPKNSNIKLTKRSDEFKEDLYRQIRIQIKQRKYALEKECIKALASKYKYFSEINTKRSIQQILLENNLEKVRCTKVIKKKIKIKDDISSNAYIIIQRK